MAGAFAAFGHERGAGGIEEHDGFSRERSDLGHAKVASCAQAPARLQLFQSAPGMPQPRARKSLIDAAQLTGSTRHRHTRAQTHRSLSRWRPGQRARPPLNCRLKNSLTGTETRPLRCKAKYARGLFYQLASSLLRPNTNICNQSCSISYIREPGPGEEPQEEN